MSRKKTQQWEKTIVHWKHRKSTGAVPAYLKFWCEGEHSGPVCSIASDLNDVANWKGIADDGTGNVCQRMPGHEAGTNEISVTVPPEFFEDAILSIADDAVKHQWERITFAPTLPVSVVEAVIEKAARDAIELGNRTFAPFFGVFPENVERQVLKRAFSRSDATKEELAQNAFDALRELRDFHDSDREDDRIPETLEDMAAVVHGLYLSDDDEMT